MFKKRNLNIQTILVTAYIIVLVIGIFSSYYTDNSYVDVFSMPGSNNVVIIDAGHGGWDPGKVSGENSDEKDINLSIALKLQQYLEQGGFYVVMTRTDDKALGDTKLTDMAKRKETADTSGGNILVSIHQNSYPDSSVSGPQVFYFDKADESKKLAEKIQLQLADFLESSKKRAAESNDNYYILKKTLLPSVIVECGFLSNNKEKELLLDEKYQNKVAWGIYCGIVGYFDIVN